MAQSYGRPPSQWLGGESWGWLDSDLTLAFSTYQRGLCGHCGYPKYMCRSDGYSWEVETDTCQAKAALDMFQEQNKKPSHGEIRYVIREENTTNYAANPFD